MSPWKTVFLKEVRENMRDKRTMFSTFVLGTLMGPVLFAGLIGLMISIMLERGEKPLELPVVGAEHAPNLVAWLKNHGVKIEDAPADPEATIRRRDSGSVVFVAGGFSGCADESPVLPVELAGLAARNFPPDFLCATASRAAIRPINRPGPSIVPSSAARPLMPPTPASSPTA